MRLLRFIGYFSRLGALLGLSAALRFAWAHLFNKLHPPRGGALACVPVGPYIFYFPSLAYFEGLFTEIFFKETYSLARTGAPIRAIDCGANIGVSLLYIKVRAPQARVLCFEPNPAARAVLEKNIAANAWEHEVRVLPYALGKAKGRTKFFVENDAETSSGGSVASHLEKAGRALNAYEVEVDTLSPYLNEDIAFLKMDIEGGEFDVLEELAAQDALRRVSLLQLEYHYIPGFFTRPLSELIALLEKNGFRTSTRPNAPAGKAVNPDAMQTFMVFAQH